MWQCSYYDQPFKNVFLLFQDFFGSQEIFNTYCNSNKMITHSFFSLLSKGKAWLQLPVTAWNCWERMAALVQTLPGLGKTQTAVRCLAKDCMLWVREQHVKCCVHVCLYRQERTMSIRTHIHIYRYIYALWISSTPQPSSLCSGRCFANHLSMGWKWKDSLYVVSNVKVFQWYTAQHFLSQISLGGHF